MPKTVFFKKSIKMLKLPDNLINNAITINFLDNSNKLIMSKKIMINGHNNRLKTYCIKEGKAKPTYFDSFGMNPRFTYKSGYNDSSDIISFPVKIRVAEKDVRDVKSVQISVTK